MERLKKSERLQIAISKLNDTPARTTKESSLIQPCARAWVAIELYDESGRPMREADYEIVAGTEVRRGKLNSQGYAIEENLAVPPGSPCSVVLPGVMCHKWVLMVQS